MDVLLNLSRPLPRLAEDGFSSKMDYLIYLFKGQVEDGPNVDPDLKDSEIDRLWMNLLIGASDIILSNMYIELNNSYPIDSKIVSSLVDQSMEKEFGIFKKALNEIETMDPDTKEMARNTSRNRLLELALDQAKSHVNVKSGAGKQDHFNLFIKAFGLIYKIGPTQEWMDTYTEDDLTVKTHENSQIHFFTEKDLWKNIDHKSPNVLCTPLEINDLPSDSNEIYPDEKLINYYVDEDQIQNKDLREVMYNNFDGNTKIFDFDRYQSKTQEDLDLIKEKYLNIPMTKNNKPEWWFLCPVKPVTREIVCPNGPGCTIEFKTIDNVKYCVLGSKIYLRPYFYQATYLPDVSGIERDQYGYDQYGYDKGGFDVFGYDAFGRDFLGRDLFGRDYHGFDKYGWSDCLDTHSINTIHFFDTTDLKVLKPPKFVSQEMTSKIKQLIQKSSFNLVEFYRTISYDTVFPNVYIMNNGAIYHENFSNWLKNQPIKINKMSENWYNNMQTFIKIKTSEQKEWTVMKHIQAIKFLKEKLEKTSIKEDISINTWSEFENLFPELKFEDLNRKVLIKVRHPLVRGDLILTYNLIDLLYPYTIQNFAEASNTGKVGKSGNSVIAKNFFNKDIAIVGEKNPIMYFGLRIWRDWNLTLAWIITNGLGSYVKFDHPIDNKRYFEYWHQRKELLKESHKKKEKHYVPVHLVKKIVDQQQKEHYILITNIKDGQSISLNADRIVPWIPNDSFLDSSPGRIPNKLEDQENYHANFTEKFIQSFMSGSKTLDELLGIEIDLDALDQELALEKQYRENPEEVFVSTPGDRLQQFTRAMTYEEESSDIEEELHDLDDQDESLKINFDIDNFETDITE